MKGSAEGGRGGTKEEGSGGTWEEGGETEHGDEEGREAKCRHVLVVVMEEEAE